jgi:uncharacterized protein YcbK (DUF882 family)
MALFSNNRSSNARRALVPANGLRSNNSLSEARRAPGVTVSEPNSPPRPVIATASATGGGALPGVDRERVLGLISSTDSRDTRGSGERRVQLASAAGLARLAPNGVSVQHSRVDVKCLKPALIRVLKDIERHYKRPVVVTSGYRDPGHNRKARGAKTSLHMYCSAVDIQVEDVTKWELAGYLREMPGRGGVGTYCHTNSVHIDIGPQRDWNWRCRRRK